MERSVKIFVILGIILAIGISVTGCSESSDQSSSDTGTVTTTAAQLYTAGDVVRSASGTESPAWLVISYDSAKDTYTRALIYKNKDGSYGYRINAATDTSPRDVMERVYTIKISHVAVASVPTAAPTTATVAATTVAVRTTATTVAGTTTAKSTARPSIKDMDPDEGEAGTAVTTEIIGADFDSNVSAMLRHSGESSITASKVTWLSSSSITCTFDLPNTTKVGSWDIIVSNPNGLSGSFTNYFLVRGNKTAAVTG